MKIKFGAFVVAGSGKIGGHVASKNRAGAYLRTKVTPTNPNTPAQASVRAVLASLSTGWSELTEAQRLGWNGAVGNFSSTDIFGDIKNPSGINLYVKLNANLIKSGQVTIQDAPAKVAVPFSGISGFTFDATNPLGGSIAFNNTDYNGVKLVVRGTRVVSPGTSYVKNLYRDIVAANGANGGVVFGAGWVNKYGNPQDGDKLFISVTPIMSNGQSGVEQTVEVIATV